MKTKHVKFFSVVLVICMLIASIPFSAAALTGIISLINLTIEEPKAGAVPQNTATLPDKASTRVLSVTWSPSDNVFKEGTDYTVTVRVGIKPGLDKAFNKDTAKMTVKVNKVQTTDVTKSGDDVVVKYTWKSEKTENTTNENTAVTKAGFSDVPDGAYYAEAVAWAVDKNITAGTSKTTFSPDATCTRAQILTFLWRAVGSPKRESFMAFDDVISSDYFFNAATWAKGKDMVSGNMFKPDTPCTRAYTVIYLWKNAGSPKTTVTNTFSDVPADSEYAEAVAWAVKNGVTSGTSKTTFSPDATCTRGQIVTFLNRALSLDNSEKEDTAVTDKKDDTADTKKDDATKKDDTKTDDKKTEGSSESGELTSEKVEEAIKVKKKYDEEKYEAAVKKALREALGSESGSGLTDLQKALRLHDWLLLNCRYDTSSPFADTSYSEYGAIVNGIAVCSGYARAYKDLLTRVGVDAEYVVGWMTPSGSMNPQPHAWNTVTIDGEKYYVDVTADDPVPDSPGRTRYNYFLISDKVLSRNHSGYSVHCTVTKYDNNELLIGYAATFIWDDRINGFYYVDMDEVKTTSDLSGSLKPTNKENGGKPTSVIMTEDGKFICFFKPSFSTSEYPMYIYSIETGEYYSYTVSGIKDVIFCRLRQNGDELEVLRDYYKNGAPYSVKAEATVPLPESAKAKKVTFDPNYDGGKVTQSEYISEYWTNGTGSFDAPVRKGFNFGGWYTEKDGGKKVESFGEIKGGDVTLYAHWFGDWEITKKPTMTEKGTAVRYLDGAPEVFEEVTLPVLSDTSFWKRTMNAPSTEKSEGKQVYTSEYGEVTVIIPKKEPEEIKFNISLKNGNIYISVPEAGVYNVGYESEEDGEVVSSAKIKVTVNDPGESVVVYPKSFTPSGTVTATLYDSEMNEICRTKFEAK